MNENTGYLRYLQGDDSGLEEVIRAYAEELCGFLQGYTGRREEAENLCQDMFVYLAVKKPRYREKGHFRAWLYAVARSKALKELRTRRRHPVLPIEECRITAEETAETTLLKQEQVRELRAAIESIRSDYREVLFLTYAEGMDNSTAAKIMGKSLRQVENLKYRAIQALRRKMKESE